MNNIKKEEAFVKLMNVRKEKPIIEHAFFDARIQHKKELIVQNLKEMQKKRTEKSQILQILEAPVIKNKSKEHDTDKPEPKRKEKLVSKKIIKKNAELNRKNAAKILVSSATEKNDKEMAKKAFEAISKIESRGSRNRLKRKLSKIFEGNMDAFNEIRANIKK